MIITDKQQIVGNNIPAVAEKPGFVTGLHLSSWNLHFQIACYLNGQIKH